MSSKVIYYYQSFVGLDDLLTHIEDVDVIIVSSIHFDNVKGKKQIYLNDNLPDDHLFDELWLQTKKASGLLTTSSWEVIPCLAGFLNNAFILATSPTE